MIALLRRLSSRFVSFRPGEATTAVLMFAYSFLAMTAYNVLGPVTRSQVIGALGADNLPYVQLASGLGIGAFMQAYGWSTARLSRRLLIPVTQAGEVALLLIFWLLLLTGAAWVPVALYVMGLVLGVLLISQFWVLAGEVYDARQAKRIFGFIGGGASLGGATGALMTALFVRTVGTNNLLLVSAALLAACAVIVAAIVARHPAATEAPAAEDDAMDSGDAFGHLKRSRHLRLIALVIAAGAIGSGIINQQVNMVAESLGGPGATDTITSFLARITLYASVIGLAIQLGLTSRIHRHLGLGVAMLMLPIGLGTTAVLVLATGAIWAPAAARVVDASLRYTVDKTTREVLFMPLPTVLTRVAKPFVDVTVDRLARAVGAVFLLVMIQPWGLGLDWRQLSYASLVVTGAWIGLAVAARREYQRAFRRRLDDHAITTSAIRIDVADDRTIDALVQELGSPDANAVLYAIDLLEALDKHHRITPLLLHHDVARVRARALAVVGNADADTQARWIPLAARLLGDEDQAVRAAAVGALALLNREGSAVTMRRYLDDPAPRVVATAAAVLATTGTEDDVRLAEGALQRLADDTRPSATDGRREAAVALASITRRDLRLMLVPLVLDANVNVAREAIRSVAASGQHDPMLVAPLVSLLGHRLLKRDARAALLGMGDEVVASLAYLLHDADEQPWVRRHIPGTLARLSTQASMTALETALDDSDGFLRYKALEAVERLHRHDATLTFEGGMIGRLINREVRRSCNYFVLRHNLGRARSEHAFSLLARTLDDKVARGIDRVYRLLGLMFPWKDIAAARRILDRGASRARAGAAEYLDGLLTPQIRRQVMPLLESLPPDERFRQACEILKTHPRELDDTLAQLVHDDDPTVSAAAVLFSTRHAIESLTSDLEFLRQNPSTLPEVSEAANWALAMRHRSDGGPFQTGTSWPIVEIVDRLRAVALTANMPIDDLFGIVTSGRLVRHEADAVMYQAGRAIGCVAFLLDGAVHLTEDRGVCDVSAPAVLSAGDALEGCPARQTVKASRPVVCLEIDAPAFLTMLGSSAVLAQGVFRSLIPNDAGHAFWDRLSMSAPPRTEGAITEDPLNILRMHPLFVRANVEQLLDLVTIAGTVSVPAGAVLFDELERPSICHVVSGQVELDGGDGARVRVEAGQTIGIAEVLTGRAAGRRATAASAVKALLIPGGDLFRLLDDRIDLLQSLFAAVRGGTV